MVRRGQGLEGLADLYKPSVPWGYFGAVARRQPETPANLPTHVQAEVLYPGHVDLSNLRAVYVPEDDHLDEVKGYLASIANTPDVPVEVRPEVFL